MEDTSSGKRFLISAYFEDLQRRVAFLEELFAMPRRDEALLLCCCYIEALGSRQSQQPERKAKNYCDILCLYGGNDIWPLIHPQQLKAALSGTKLFRNVLPSLEPVIEKAGTALRDPNNMASALTDLLNREQRNWLGENIFKGSMAYISYERIRSELVHDISAAPSVSFSLSTYNGGPIPEIDFELLYASLRGITNTLARNAIASGKWWWE